MAENMLAEQQRVLLEQKAIERRGIKSDESYVLSLHHVLLWLLWFGVAIAIVVAVPKVFWVQFFLGCAVGSGGYYAGCFRRSDQYTYFQMFRRASSVNAFEALLFFAGAGLSIGALVAALLLGRLGL